MMNHQNGEQRMTSIEIAELTGKQHKDVMKAIRNMESAWVNVQGRKFALLQKIYNLPNGGTKLTPYYLLTKTECLYIATKFNDEYQCALLGGIAEFRFEPGQIVLAALRFSTHESNGVFYQDIVANDIVILS